MKTPDAVGRGPSGQGHIVGDGLRGRVVQSRNRLSLEAASLSLWVADLLHGLVKRSAGESDRSVPDWFLNIAPGPSNPPVEGRLMNQLPTHQESQRRTCLYIIKEVTSAESGVGSCHSGRPERQHQSHPTPHLAPKWENSTLSVLLPFIPNFHS